MYRLVVISLLAIIFIFKSGKGQQDYVTPPDNIHNCTLPDSNSFKLEDLDPDCLEYFNIHAIKKKSENKLTKSQFNYIQSLIREGAGVLKTLERDKRQIRFQKRVRRECRTLSDEQRNDLWYSMRYLKFNTTDRVYDMFADYHAIPSIEAIIHRGPNFLGWHRVYLFYFERALMRIKPVPLCYWDSTLDFLIPGDGQRRSVMFTDKLVGNGMGQVINGPFRDWFVPRMNGTLRRNIGRRASLVRPWIADQIMYSQNISSHNQIVTVGGNRVSIEGEHNGVHVWVGEVMMDILSAPQDGVFWLHHTYVDYLWERFRQKLVRLGRNPEIDYPDPTDGQHPGHNGSDPMPIFYSQYHFIWTNQRGYSNLLMNFYEYADHPTCGNACGGNTKFLYCPNNNTNNASTRCVSRTAEMDTVPEEALGQFGGRNLSEFDFKNGTATSSINNTNSLGEMAAALEGPLSKSAWQFTSKLKDNRLN